MSRTPQLVADALADAETLRAALPLTHFNWPLLRYVPPQGMGPSAAYESTCYLARAAFRAVPKLRGEEVPA